MILGQGLEIKLYAKKSKDIKYSKSAGSTVLCVEPALLIGGLMHTCIINKQILLEKEGFMVDKQRVKVYHMTVSEYSFSVDRDIK